MKLTHLLNIQNPWLRATNEDSEIILSSWVHLSRNIKNFPFVNSMNQKDKQVLRSLISEKISAQLKEYKFNQILLDEIEPEDLLLLKERRLIEHASPTLAEAATLFHTNSETKAILVNAFDHLKVQMASQGLAIQQLWANASKLDDELMHIFQFAYKEPFGFLTTALSQVGTGLKVEFLLHLPISVFTGKISPRINQLKNEGFTIKHFFEDTELPIGNLFIVSNQNTIGFTETEIVEKMENCAIQLSLEERTLRDNLFQNNKEEMLDKIYRSFGLLSNSYRISFQEAYTYLSILKIGIDIKIINFITQNQWSRLFQSTLPAHIQVEKGEKLSKEAIDEARAEILSRKLKALEKQA